MSRRSNISYALHIKTNNEDIKNLYGDDRMHAARKTRGDSGLDLYTTKDYIIPKGSLGFTIDFGIQCEMIEIDRYTPNPCMTFSPDYRNVAYWLLPRSSISNTPLRMCNSMGLIDRGYRGNIMAKVDNVGDADYHLPIGQRLFQLALPNLEYFDYNITDKLSETVRGSGGFGSTGK